MTGSLALVYLVRGESSTYAENTEIEGEALLRDVLAIVDGYANERRVAMSQASELQGKWRYRAVRIPTVRRMPIRMAGVKS